MFGYLGVGGQPANVEALKKRGDSRIETKIDPATGKPVIDPVTGKSVTQYRTATTSTGWFEKQPGPVRGYAVSGGYTPERAPFSDVVRQSPGYRTDGEYEQAFLPGYAYGSGAEGRYDESKLWNVYGQPVSKNAPQMTWYVNENYWPTTPTNATTEETKEQTTQQQYYTSAPSSVQTEQQAVQQTGAEAAAPIQSGFDWKILALVAVAAYFLLKKKQ